MFSKPTVFVVGAGASKEVGLPLGDELKRRIAKAIVFRKGKYPFSHDEELYSAFVNCFPRDMKKYTDAGSALSAAIDMYVSIDEALNYYATEEETVLLGKAAIARQILKAERESVLSTSRTGTGRPELFDAAQSWLMQFLSLAFSGIRRDNISNVFQQITIVNFNYDRSLEHYLYWALQSTARLNADEAQAAIGRLNIVRPYGSVGKLEWQGDGGIAFGGTEAATADQLFALVPNLSTYMEQHLEGVPESVDAALAQSSLVVILGFGFHPQNMQLIRCTLAGGQPSRKVIATVMGVAEENRPGLRQQLVGSLHSGDVILVEKTAAQTLFDLRPTIQRHTS